MLAEGLTALAAAAGNTVVTAATSDAWEAARRGFARLLGRGDAEREQLAEQRLEETREQLAGHARTDREEARAALAAQWTTRLADLLEENPDADVNLRTLVQKIQKEQRAGTVSAADLAVAAGQDMTISASSGGIAAGVIQANLGFFQPQATTPGQPVRLAPRPLFLAGREDLLADLRSQLTAADSSGPRIVALCGLAGSGKTSVALEYAHRHLVKTGLAWQLAAEDSKVLEGGFGELAVQLGARGVAIARDPVASVHAVLRADRVGWLLIFDNAPGPASVARFLPPAGPGQVLITSQNLAWPPGQALHVPVLDLEVAAGFLVSRTRDPDRQAARDLAGLLGGLPLALEQAAAYITAAGDTIADYLALFRKRRTEMLARGEPLGYGKTVATTWTLAFGQLEESAPSAVGLLRLLSFCAPEAIPLRLVLQSFGGLVKQLGPDVAPVLAPLLEDPLVRDDVIAALRRYSLITPALDGSVSVNELVQVITLNQIPAGHRPQWHRAAAALIEAAIPANTKSPRTWPVCATLLPHAQRVLADHSVGMARIASYLGHSGSHAAARDLQSRIAEACACVHGPENPDTLTARHELAHWTGRAGDPAGARDQFAGLLPIREGASGAEHPDTLTARAGLAYWTGEAGDPAAARNQLAGLLPIRERASGAEHPDTLTARADLARWTGQAGDEASARDQFAALLPIRERVLGPEHPDTLITRASLAYWTGQAGDRAGARDQFADLLPVIKRAYGAEHPETLTNRRSLARWTGDAGDPAGARDQLAALLPIIERVSGAEHPNTLTARSDLAYWTGRAGDEASARDQFAALLPIRERVLGPEHPDTLTDRANLARWTGDAGTRAGARDQFADLLPVRTRVSGPEHPETLNACAGLAYWTGQAGDAAGARDQLAALLPVRERVSGPEHPDTLNARHELAHWTGRAGDAAGARDRFADLLPIRERVLGPEHPDTLSACAGLAGWTGEAGDPVGARDQFVDLLPIIERVFGPEHPETLAARASLARWTGEAGDPAEACAMFADLLPIRERVLGTEHPDTLTARADLAHWTGRAGLDPAAGLNRS
jgi:Tetratricopeptide repeat